MRGAEAPASTDHRIIVADISLLPAKSSKPKRAIKLDADSLSRDPRTLSNYRVAVSNRFAALSDLPQDVESAWASIRDGILHAATATIPPVRNKRRPWLTNETLDVLDLKRAARLVGNRQEQKRLLGIFKAKAKVDLEAWYSSIADDVELGISRHDPSQPTEQSKRYGMGTKEGVILQA